MGLASQFKNKVAAQAVEVERSRVLVRKTLYDGLHEAKPALPSSLKDDDLVANLNELEKTMFDNHKCTLVELSPDYWKHFALVTASIAQEPWYVRLTTAQNLAYMYKIEHCEKLLERATDLGAKRDEGTKKRKLEEMEVAPEVLPEDQPAMKDHALLRDAAKKLKAKHDAEINSVAASLVEEMKKEEAKGMERAAAMAEEDSEAVANELQREEATAAAAAPPTEEAKAAAEAEELQRALFD